MRGIVLDNESSVVESITSVFHRFAEFQLIGIFSDPNKGLSKVIQYKPDVVFMDVALNETCGIDIARKIKDNLNHVMIVFITKNPNLAVQAFEIGAVDYILKPLNPKRLEVTVKRILNKLEADEVESRHLMIRTFGELQFKWSDQRDSFDVRWRTRKTQELFLYLLYQRENPVYIDVIIDLLWPDVDIRSARTQLYSAIYQMRKTLREINSTIEIINNESTYMMQLNQTKHDVHEWELAMGQLPTLSNKTVEEHIEVIKMYKGDFLEKFNYSWAIEEKELLHSIWKHHIQQVNRILEEQERYIESLRLQRYVIKVSPLNEGSYFQLMKILNHMNNKDGVIQTYRRLKSMLEKEFGAEPNSRVRNWYKFWLEKETLMNE